MEAAITRRTRAIVPVHYAGVGCEMDPLAEIASRHGLLLIEDAAQGILSTYRGRALGTIGQLGALSFHGTKNIVSGEGGALLCRDSRFVERSEILREKGTNRAGFLRGATDRYTWHDLGSSYAPGEIVAAFLLAQMQEAGAITDRRMQIWNRYHQAFEPAERAGRIRRPVVPEHCVHNAHAYYLLLRDCEDRDRFIVRLRERGIQCTVHFLPLHSSPLGRRLGKVPAPLPITQSAADRIVRLPLWLGLEGLQDRVLHEVLHALR